MTVRSGLSGRDVAGLLSTPSRVVGAVSRRLGHYGSDLNRLIRYGPRAPLYAEKIWVDPGVVSANPFPKQEGYLKSDSGRVHVEAWPETDRTPRDTDIRIDECLQHWADGKSWEETGRLDRWADILRTEGVVYNCTSMEEVRTRLVGWDRIFEQVRAEGRIRPRDEINPGNFRERGGIGIHVGPSGRLYKGRGGHHRFAMSLALGLPVIPAQIGVVHVSAIPMLKQIRSKPSGAR
jgi:hypothetical protein